MKDLRFTLAVFFAGTLLCTQGFSSLWSISSKYTKPDKDGIIKSVIILSQGQKRLEYLPPQPPFGVTNIRRFKLNNKLYFLTVWPKGPKSFVYRVFSPENNSLDKLHVICDVVTFSEEPKMERRGDSILIETQLFDTKKDKMISLWRKCD